MDDWEISYFDGAVVTDITQKLKLHAALNEALNKKSIYICNLNVIRLPSSQISDGILLIGDYNDNGTLQGVIHISQLHDFDQINRAFLNSKWFSDNVSHGMRHVHLPIYVGSVENRTFSYSKFCHPLSSGLLWALQKRVIRPYVLDWLTNFSSNTKEAEFASTSKYLNFFVGKKGLSENFMKYVDVSMSSLSNGSWNPVHIPDHNDLWKGNVLLESLVDFSRFKVIDWGAANPKGYGVHDLLTFSLSFGVNHKSLKKYLNVYSKNLGVSHDVLIFQYIASAGYLGVNINNFPYVRYCNKINREFNFLLKSLAL